MVPFNSIGGASIMNIAFGFIVGVCFWILVCLAEYLAGKFYSEVEEEFDIISVKVPFILLMIIAGFMFFKINMMIMVVFLITFLSCLLLEDKYKPAPEIF